MTCSTLPTKNEMYQAVSAKDTDYDGVFFTAVRTTGIFCKPSCAAKTPKLENVEFYPSTREALVAGYRPCKRCRPMEAPGEVPTWLRDLLNQIDSDPLRKWTDADLRRVGVEPTRVRRWFQKHHEMTFHAYQRARRIGLALGQIRYGDELSRAAYDSGFESESGFREAFKRLFGRPPGSSRDGRTMVVTRLQTPIGSMMAAAVDEGVCLLEFGDRRMLETQLTRLMRYLPSDVVLGENDVLAQLNAELREYFEGTRKSFDVPIVYPGTDFQRACWEWLRSIPYGETRTYGEEAKALGIPNAFRAVGRANGDNRLGIIIPCHRVIRSDGQLAGYGGGKWRKQWMLDFERSRI